MLPCLEASSTFCGSPRSILGPQGSETSGIRVPGGQRGPGLRSRTSPPPRGRQTHPRDGEGCAEVPAAYQAEAPWRRAAQGYGVWHRGPKPQPEPEPDTEEPPSPPPPGRRAPPPARPLPDPPPPGPRPRSRRARIGPAARLTLPLRGALSTRPSATAACRQAPTPGPWRPPGWHDLDARDPALASALRTGEPEPGLGSLGTGPLKSLRQGGSPARRGMGWESEGCLNGGWGRALLKNLLKVLAGKPAAPLGVGSPRNSEH